MIVLSMLVACLSLYAEGQSIPEGTRAREIKLRVETGLDAEAKLPSNRLVHPQAITRRFLASLGNDEIRLLAREAHVNDLIKEEAFYHWARFDPEGALKGILQIAESVKEEAAVNGPPGAINEIVKGYITRLYFSVLLGWSETAPKVAWESFKNRDGTLANLAEFEEHPARYYELIFHHLAEVDPDLAFQEIQRAQAPEYSEYSISSMLAGYLHSAPRGRDWHAEVTLLLERKWVQKWVKNEIRTALMGRWLEDAPEAAEKWFASGDVKGLHWSDGEEVDGDLDWLVSDKSRFIQNQEPEKERPYHLGTAAGYWAARDFQKAWKWMNSYGQFRREGFAEAVLYGIQNYQSNPVTYIFTQVGGEDSARIYFLEKTALLEDEGDRAELALRFADVLWVFHEISVLGEPKMDKAKWLESVRSSISQLQINPEATEAIVQKLQKVGDSEHVGADQPASALESKPEDRDNPQTEAEGRSR